MKITKGTIIRTLVLAFVLINYILGKMGINLIDISESQISEFVEMAVSVLAIIAAWWKNNSFSDFAKKADEYLKQLRGE